MRSFFISLVWLSLVLLVGSCKNQQANQRDLIGLRVDSLLNLMTIEEKIGQMAQLNSEYGYISDERRELIQLGKIGSILNEGDAATINELQRTAVEESRLGIPLIIGRDVIHGFKTIFPINIGMAATFNPELIRIGSEMAAIEASSTGINWNFAPMVDIARDPRWGRMAESFGEDPLLVSRMGLAVMQGFQGDDLSLPHTMAATAKHFAGYGAAEGGRDYNTTSIPEVELWNVYFKPFQILADNNIATFMTGFNELNGIPASGNAYLFRDVLKDKWQFDGMVVSDWASIVEMISHGYAKDEYEAARKAVIAGVDMEMASDSYSKNLYQLLKDNQIKIEQINDAVSRILRIKFRLGLFENPYRDLADVIKTPPTGHLEAAKQTAIQSLVLLKNQDKTLPLKAEQRKIAIIGPMADDKYEQLSTWNFDGDTNLSVTPRMAFEEFYGKKNIFYAKGLKNTRTFDKTGFNAAINAAKKSDVTLVFLGEEAILVGEAHSRSNLNFTGAQEELFNKLSELGKPIVLVVMTPRPLAIGKIMQNADAVIYAWHPGTMSGPAILDVLTGVVSPSGKLPVTFPKTAGQIPIYYAHKNSGRPASGNTWVKLEDIPERAVQTSLGNTNHYLDIGFDPLFPFGYGLSYTTFDYEKPQLSSLILHKQDTLFISTKVQNTGMFDADEVVQLYLRDQVASITRPVKELKDFKRLHFKAGETKEVIFKLAKNELGFYNAQGDYLVEPGLFSVWVTAHSACKEKVEFELIKN